MPKGASIPHGRSSSHVEAFEQEPRRRPTTSVSRRDKGRHGKAG